MQITPDQAARLYAAALTFRDGADDARERMNAAGIFCPHDLLYGAALASDVLREIAAAQIDAPPAEEPPEPDLSMPAALQRMFLLLLVMGPVGAAAASVASRLTGFPLAGIAAILAIWLVCYRIGKRTIARTKFF